MTTIFENCADAILMWHDRFFKGEILCPSDLKKLAL